MNQEPIRLISKDKSNRLELNVEALEKIEKINEKFGVFVWIGSNHQDKSHFLSRLIGDDQNSFNKTTKGITIWSEVIKFKTSNGVQNLILLDTEDFASDDSNSEWDKKLFLVSLVLSSMLVYSTNNKLIENSFKKLATIISSNDDVSNKASVRYAGLHLTVRDFSLIYSQSPEQNLENFTQAKQVFEYLESKHKENENIKLEIKTRNQISENKIDVFKKIDVCCLIHPVLDEINGLAYQQAMSQKIIDEFVSNFRRIFQFKKLKNEEINGSLFVELIKQIVEIINNNCTINLFENQKSSFNLNLNKLNYDLLDRVKVEYESKMESLQFPLDFEDFEVKERVIYKACVEILEPLDSNTLNEIKVKFDQFVYGKKGAYIYYMNLNQRAIDLQNIKAIENIWNDSMKSKLNYFETSSTLDEINLFKSYVLNKFLECKNFEKLWEEFSRKLNLKVLVDRLNETKTNSKMQKPQGKSASKKSRSRNREL